MFPELQKSYQPHALEQRWARAWIEHGWFTASNDPADSRPTWALVIPPPNVTGSLHMGHMLEHTLIDAVVRWRRMRGDNTLWLPGTDHAGIATQMVVERSLAAEGRDRRAMGREAFVAAVWEWKQRSGDRIKEQMIRLGASCDWTRERFTLDPGLSRAVREVFVRLYEQGLIYRGRYIVNWCPRCHTAVSDLEVTHEEGMGKLYQVRYPVVGHGGAALVVATTRPETILADVAVAVNPADERYRHLVGAQVEVPLTGRQVPVIADEIARPEFGTGAVKITPGHDANDYLAGERHGLAALSVIDENGAMSAEAGPYAGLDRFEARARVVADLEAAGVLAGVEDHAMAVGRCQRCATVIEPRVSTQWFVRTAPLAAPAVEAVRAGAIRFTPENNARIFFEWMANLRDWCISRQLWWGHRIPAWYCSACGEVTVAREDPVRCPGPGCAGRLEQDPDVLDTWFSSALWPFSTLGWPDTTPDLTKFYPTALLITGFDILFFWVARMAMMGLHFMRPEGAPLAAAVPFRDVYIHALVRDADKQKMSKTKGNVIDPLVVTEKYGTDAVRFTLAAMAAPGADIALSETRMQGYAAFANKIWNAARFVFLSLDKLETEGRGLPGGARQSEERVRAIGDHAVDRWLFSRLNAVAAEVNQALEAFRFHDAADRLYHFFWHEFCDWYVELCKLRLQASDADAARTAAANLLVGLEAGLRLLHIFMPFLTEELWQALHAGAPPRPTIAWAAYPQPDPAAADAAAEREIALLQEAVTAVRSLRAEWRLGQKAPLTVRVAVHNAAADAALRRHSHSLRALAETGEVTFVAVLPAAARAVSQSAEFDLEVELDAGFDFASERQRVSAELVETEKLLAAARRRLADPGFRDRAPRPVVDEAERLAADLERRARQLALRLERLG